MPISFFSRYGLAIKFLTKKGTWAFLWYIHTVRERDQKQDRYQ